MTIRQPAFTSFSKYYFGTLEQLKGLFDDIRSEENTAKSHASILSTFDRFLAGEKNIKHYARIKESRFLCLQRYWERKHPC